MASYHHYHHHQQNTAAHAPNPCTCCNPCNPQFSPFNDHHSPPYTDPTLLQAIVSQLLQQQQGVGGAGVPFCQTQSFHQQRRHFQNHQRREEENPLEKYVLSSLHSRIEALETSLHKVSLSYRSNHQSLGPSLRDTAARVIQTHFRAFLVRRSRTLRLLKELALIKSSFNSLKLSVSKKTHLDYGVTYRKAMNLLRKLDSIQGGDPMIRDGKLSIRMDLVRFLEFIDGVPVKRQEISFKAAKSVRFGGNSNKSRVFRDESDIMDKLGARIEKLDGLSRVCRNEDEDVEFEGFQQVSDDEDDEENPRLSINGKNVDFRNKNGILMKSQVVPQPRVKRSVSLADNGNVYRIVSNEPNSSDESVSNDEDGKVGVNLSNGVEKIKGLSTKRSEEDDNVDSENGEERNPRRSPRREARNNMNHDCRVKDGKLVFSPPLPVKMETRDDSTKNRKAVKFAL